MSLQIGKIDIYAPSIMLFFLYSLLVFCSPCKADRLDVFCPNTTGNYTTNSPFEANLKTLLISLSSNTSGSGFYNTSVGDGSNQVYGRALCRGDVSSKVCQNCVETASRDIVQQCPNKEDAIIWYEFCQVHYSYKKFSMMVYAGKFPPWNDHEQTVSDPSQFIMFVKDLMTNLSFKAAFASNRMFATGYVSISRTDMLYGLVQCTRDKSGSYCKNCLQNAIGDIEGCCYSHRGGMILDTSCDLRFEMYPFYQSSSPLSPTTTAVKGNRRKIPKAAVFIPVPAVVLVVLMASIGYYLWGRKGAQNVGDKERSQHTLLHHLGSSRNKGLSTGNFQEENLMNPEVLHFMDVATIRVATDNFSDSNKLGQGGFGTVYKGTMQDGKEIAVKRLSARSWQGLEEFKNEVILIAKLQHKNLVKLLGCGIEGEEKLLIYEFMPNISLDVFIFDPVKRSQLDWRTRLNIIGGIARGLLYLHEDSRLKIIHRDMKPSNILLDHEMVAKISDFGMARIFCENQNTANTRRVVGTFGYMAPEYAMAGLFSVKSDVFSFGVILLEIVSGHKNNSFYHGDRTQTLAAHAWRLWKEGKELDFVDPLVNESCSTMEVLRCIHIGLLCVQEDAEDRPTMASLVVMLESESMALPEPNQPAFSVGRAVAHPNQSSTSSCSVNDVTISSISAR